MVSDNACPQEFFLGISQCPFLPLKKEMMSSLWSDDSPISVHSARLSGYWPRRERGGGGDGELLSLPRPQLCFDDRGPLYGNFSRIQWQAFTETISPSIYRCSRFRVHVLLAGLKCMDVKKIWSHWSKWRNGGSNPGPSATICKADALPLSHFPSVFRTIDWLFRNQVTIVLRK